MAERRNIPRRTFIPSPPPRRPEPDQPAASQALRPEADQPGDPIDELIAAIMAQNESRR